MNTHIFTADCHAKLWLSRYYNRNPFHDTITIQNLLSGYIMILSSFPNKINFVDFIKTGLPVKMPSITALQSICFAINLTNIFAQQKSFLISYFVNLDKMLQNGIMQEKMYTNKNYQNYWQLKRRSVIVSNCWKHYHDSTIMAVTITVRSITSTSYFF